MTSTVLTDVLKARTTNGNLTISGNGTGNVDMKNLATTDDTPMVLTLQTGETDMAADDVIGTVNFQAPDEGTGTDAILVAAGIEAVSEGDFSSSSNATKLSFKTAASEAASEKASLSSTGVFTATSFSGSGAGLTAGTTPVTTLDIDGATDIGEAIVDADLLIIDNGAGGTNRKTAASRLATYVGASAGAFSIANLDIDGGTDIGEAIVDADLFIIDNGAGGTNRKTTASRLKTYVGAGDASGPGSSTDNAIARFDGTGGKTLQNSGVVIDDNNILTNSAQPAFLGAATATQDNITGNSISSAIAFAEVFDNNADYDGTTFTAPVAGRYQFNANVRFGGVTTAATNISIDLVTSNREYQSMSRIDGNTGNNAGQSGSWCCDMDASDTAVVKVFGEGEASNVWDLNIGAAKLCTFSGFLVG